MPIKPRAMLPWQESKISKNYRFLKVNIDAKNIQDYFMDAEIFNMRDLEEIDSYNPNTAENRNNCFLKLLFNSGPAAYDVFLKALRENGQDHVADRIAGTEVSQEKLEASNNKRFATSEVAEEQMEASNNKYIKRFATSEVAEKQMEASNNKYIKRFATSEIAEKQMEASNNKYIKRFATSEVAEKQMEASNNKYIKKIATSEVAEEQVEASNNNHLEPKAQEKFATSEVAEEQVEASNNKKFATLEVAEEQIAASKNNNLTWLTKIHPSIRKQRLKERELRRLAQTFGKDWKSVASDLGLSQTDIEHMNMEQMKETQKITSCLNKWRLRDEDQATFENFIRILNNGEATTINWEQIKNIVEDSEKEYTYGMSIS